MTKRILLLLAINLIFWTCAKDEELLAEDCAGSPGGLAVLDSCNVCDDNPANDCIQDCLGSLGGTASIDSCNVCDDNPANDCIQDCLGSWGGTASIDNCGV